MEEIHNEVALAPWTYRSEGPYRVIACTASDYELIALHGGFTMAEAMEWFVRFQIGPMAERAAGVIDVNEQIVVGYRALTADPADTGWFGTAEGFAELARHQPPIVVLGWELQARDDGSRRRPAGRGAVMRVEFAADVPGKLVSINETSGKQWYAWMKEKEVWLQAGYVYGLQWRRELRELRVPTPLQERATLAIDFDVRQNRRRDGHNYTGTVIKWFVDGMVTARLFADDSSEHLEVRDPTFSVRPRGEILMRVTLEMP